MDRYLFLDFDGVLNRWPTQPPGRGRYDPGSIHERKGLTWQWLDTSRCALLEDVLVRRVRDLVAETGAKVIVSSDWRTRLGLEGLKEMLATAGWPDPPLTGTTRLDLAWMGCPRHEEVADWLRCHGEPAYWVALDDNWGGVDGLSYPVVEVDPVNGVTEADKDAARALLIPTSDSQGSGGK